MACGLWLGKRDHRDYQLINQHQRTNVVMVFRKKIFGVVDFLLFFFKDGFPLERNVVGLL